MPMAARRRPNGSFVPRRLLADREDAGQRVELVGQRDRDAGAGARQLTARAARQ